MLELKLPVQFQIGLLMVIKLKAYFFFFFLRRTTVSLSIGEQMNHDCEVNEIIACITVSLFATEICTDITNEARGKALSLQNSLPQVFFTYELLSFAMLFQGNILISLLSRQN